jgi:hypothetical protein
MIIKLFIFSLFASVASAQEVIKDPIIIRDEDFQKGTTFDVALDQIYKRIIPKKSTKDHAKCFWMLGDGKYLIVRVEGSDSDKPSEIEPMMIQKLEKLGKDGVEYLVNKTEEVSTEGLIESITAYNNLAKANDAKPIVMISRSKNKLSGQLVLLQKIRKLGVKHIYIPAPVKHRVAEPLIPLPKNKPLPASPHRK